MIVGFGSWIGIINYFIIVYDFRELSGFKLGYVGRFCVFVVCLYFQHL